MYKTMLYRHVSYGMNDLKRSEIFYENHPYEEL